MKRTIISRDLIFARGSVARDWAVETLPSKTDWKVAENIEIRLLVRGLTNNDSCSLIRRSVRCNFSKVILG